MSVKIIEHKKNPLMGREEVRAVFEHAGRPTPTRDEIMPFIEKALKIESERILIDKIFTAKGKGESNLKVFVYDKKEDMPKRNLELIKKRAEKGKAEAKEEHKEEKHAEHKAEHAKHEDEKAHEKHEEKK